MTGVNRVTMSRYDALNHRNYLGAESSLFVPQFLGAEKLRRQCEADCVYQSLQSTPRSCHNLLRWEKHALAILLI